MKKRVLNLYAGIGGNRLLWGNGIDVTAVELNNEVADFYKSQFPCDRVVIGDAHGFLINNFQEFDFIWSSPPCPTHSRASTALAGYNVYRYPDMKLYEEIIFLSKFYKGKFVIENVVPYYKPLIQPTQKIDRHLFWSNFVISEFQIARKGNVGKATKEQLAHEREVAIPEIKGARKALRNMVHPKIGQHIFTDYAKSKEGK